MTIDELKICLKNIAKDNDGDIEGNHCNADDLIVDFLAQLDPEIKTIFDSINKWYA